SDIVGQLRRGSDYGLLFGMRIGPRVSLAARRTMLGQHHSLVLSFGNAPVRDQTAGIELNLDLVPGLAHLHAAADPVHRNRVPVAVQCDIPFDIDQPLMQPVDLRNPYRQWFQVHSLDGEQLTRNRADVFLVSRVDFVAPLPRPLVQIFPTAESAPRQKVMLYEMKGTFYALRTVRIPNRVRHDLKAEALSTGGHL